MAWPGELSHWNGTCIRFPLGKGASTWFIKPNCFQSPFFKKIGPTINQLQMYTQVCFDSIFLKLAFLHWNKWLAACFTIKAPAIFWEDDIIFPAVPLFDIVTREFISCDITGTLLPHLLWSYHAATWCWGNWKTDTEVGIWGGRHQGSHIAGS